MALKTVRRSLITQKRLSSAAAALSCFPRIRRRCAKLPCAVPAPNTLPRACSCAARKLATPTPEPNVASQATMPSRSSSSSVSSMSDDEARRRKKKALKKAMKKEKKRQKRRRRRRKAPLAPPRAGAAPARRSAPAGLGSGAALDDRRARRASVPRRRPDPRLRPAPRSRSLALAVAAAPACLFYDEESRLHAAAVARLRARPRQPTSACPTRPAATTFLRTPRGRRPRRDG